MNIEILHDIIMSNKAYNIYKGQKFKTVGTSIEPSKGIQSWRINLKNGKTNSVYQHEFKQIES